MGATPGANGNDSLKVHQCTLQHRAEARSGGGISSLNDHVAQRSFRKEAYAEKIYKINQFRYPGAGGKHKNKTFLFIMNSHGLTLHFTMESLILAQDER